MTKNKLFLFTILLTFSVFIFSCGKKVPREFQSLEGVWQNEEVYMEISSDGTFGYKRQSKGQSVSINTWITDYSAKGFSASTVFGKADFVVDKKPFYNDSLRVTQMMVDGRTLTKREN